MTTLNKSWLVQRLNRPHNSRLFKDNPFSFGGGLVNGGLSSDAMSLLRPVFSFDYMGAAEFEFGEVPKALNKIAEAAGKSPRKSKLTAFTFDVPLSTVPANWQAPKDAPTPEGSATIYALSHRDHAEEVERRVREWATGEERLKEPTRLTNALRPFHEWDGETAGWLELNNGFFFFTDRDMWAQTCSLFGVEAEERAA